MEKQIWKFEVSWNETTIQMPKDAEILTMQLQNGKRCFWALVNPKNEHELRYFEIYGTGHSIYYDMGITRKYIGTFQLEDGLYVFHLFERID